MNAVSLSPSDIQTAVACSSLEWKFTDANAFGVTTASPLQRAVCRIADGKGVGSLAGERSVVDGLGGQAALSSLPKGKPRELFILSGIRTGKSLIAATLAVHWSQTCNVSKLGPGEIPRVSIVSLTKDLADVVFNHVVGRLQQSPLLASLVIGQPSTDSVHVRHPTGRVVQIKVVAGSRAGSSLVARWSAGTVFDEAPRMVGESEGVVNWNDSRDAVLLRLLPGCQLVHIGSPWAPFGPAYELVSEYWGKPSQALVVVRAPAFDMNPAYWTPETVEAAKSEPDVFRTDVLAEFSTPEEALFSADVVERSTRAGPDVLPPEPGAQYVAAMDPATRGNGWTLIIATRKGNKKIVVGAYEWIGSRHNPLSPSEVLTEIAAVLKPYGVRTVDSDQYMGDALVSLGQGVKLGDQPYPLNIVHYTLTGRERAERYLAIRTRLELGEIELPPATRLRADLLRVRKQVTQTGVTIVLPQTSDGRHCDHAPSFMLAMSRFLTDVEPSRNEQNEEAARMRAQAMKRFGRSRETW